MYHRYTEADDRVIARYMALFETPACFRRSAEALGVSEQSIRSRYRRRQTFILACTFNYIHQTDPVLNSKSELKRLSIWTLALRFIKRLMPWKKRK